MDITQVDRNFAVPTSLSVPNIKFHDAREEPFSIYGVFYENGKFRRLPEKVAESVSDRVYKLHTHTAGGRIKFKTNSPFIAIQAVMPQITKLSHFSLTGSASFDLYVGKNEQYFGTFVPPKTITDGYESLIEFGSITEREITINFPLYSSISQLYIGLHEDATLKKGSDYKHKKPIVFYGSSITQGGCASRPGTSYESIISRALKTDYTNLGFSGSAKGEDEIAQYIKALDMSVFVYDYDANAPDVAHLEATHERMFSIIREHNPDLPIIMMTYPRYTPTDSQKARLEVVRKTYRNALEKGDSNVYFLDGPTLMKYAKNEGTVENKHPNDLGFYSMAKVLIKQLKIILH